MFIEFFEMLHLVNIFKPKSWKGKRVLLGELWVKEKQVVCKETRRLEGRWG